MNQICIFFESMYEDPWLVAQPLLLSNPGVAAMSLVHPQDLIRQVAAFRSVLLPHADYQM